MKLTILSILALTFSLSAHAATNEMVTIIPSKGVLQDSSEHMRMGKTYVLTAQLLGLAVSPVSSAGINGGIYLDRNSVLQLEAASGSSNWLYYNLKASLVSLNYKHFFGNSFYLKVGGAYRDIAITDYSYNSTTKVGTLGSAKSIVGDIAIGNQWQFENFTLGCDWIGLNPHIATLSTEQNYDGLGNYDATEIRKDWESIAKVTSAQLLRFYVGASF